MKRASLAFPLLLATLSVHGQDATSCLKCHDPAADFKDMTSEQVTTAASDTSIMAHKRYGRLSDEELQAIVDTLMSGVD